VSDDAPSLTFAFEAAVAVGPPEPLGGTGDGELLHYPIHGGEIDGPRLRGTVRPGGGDRAVRRGHVYTLDARYLIEADDGALIDVVNRGVWRGSADLEARLDAGEPVAPDELYFRTSPVFHTAAAAHRWLTETVFVGVAHDESFRGLIRIRFFAVD
jgi:hypothetical protein